MAEEFLYHFTSVIALKKIMEAGYLKLTPSNLIQPKDLKHVAREDGTYEYVSEMSDPVKPVVWLTNEAEPDDTGNMSHKDFSEEMKRKWLDADKYRIRITVANDTSKYFWWHTWSDKNRMNKKWKQKFTYGLKYSAWYVSEEIIKLEDVLLIEDLHEGTILLDNRDKIQGKAAE